MTSSFTGVNAQDVARRLRSAECLGEPIPPLTASYPELTVHDAYRIQLENVRHRTGRGVCVVGHKVGLTSKAMQEMLGVDEPDYGHIFDEILIEDGDELKADRLIAPRAEPEIAFVLGRDLAGDEIDAEQVIRSTAHVLPSLEIIDSRIADWKIGLVDTVADNASCARVVLGTLHTPVNRVNLPTVSVTMKVNGAVAGEGTGSAVLGNPAEAVAWLANAVAAYGVTLKAGHVILPGAMCRAADIGAGDHVVADFGELGTVEVHCR